MALSKNLRRFALTVICVTLISGQASFAQEEVVTETGSETTAVAAVNENIVTVGTVGCGVLNVRLDAGTEYTCLGKLYQGNQVVVTDSRDGWFYVTNGWLTGWVSSEYIANIQSIPAGEYMKQVEAAAATAASSDVTDQVVAYSRQFIGKPYASGGNGPSSFDCSGLVRYVYGAYGVDIPRSSKSIANIGQAVALSDIQPGDIMCFATGGGGVSHVGIYVGDGQLLHASTGRRGVTYDGIYDPYYAKTLVKIVRVA